MSDLMAACFHLMAGFCCCARSSKLGVADRLAACIKDLRSPKHITHRLADNIGFRMMMIAAGYEDGHDTSNLRVDPMFKMALDLTPSVSGPLHICRAAPITMQP
jgi:hypothetical protein